MKKLYVIGGDENIAPKTIMDASSDIVGSAVYCDYRALVRDSILSILYCDIPTSIFNMIADEIADKLDAERGEVDYAIESACKDAWERLQDHMYPEKPAEDVQEPVKEKSTKKVCKKKLPF